MRAQRLLACLGALGVAGGAALILANSPYVSDESPRLPVYVSPAADSGNRFQSFEARMEAGWATALYVYWPGDLTWDASWADFVAKYPEGIPVLGSPKEFSAQSVRAFLDELPQSWRDKWTMAYYQEPEDNFTTAAQRAQFRERVGQMAELVRPYGVTNAVHLQEWTLNPENTKSWAGETAAAELFAPEDVDKLSWSLYRPVGESMVPNIDRVKAFSEKYAPGVSWGVTAAGSPVPPSAPVGGQLREERADIVREGAEYVAEVGGQAFGWFDHDGFIPGDDQLAAKDPALAAALQDIAQLEVTEP